MVTATVRQYSSRHGLGYGGEWRGGEDKHGINAKENYKMHSTQPKIILWTAAFVSTVHHSGELELILCSATKIAKGPVDPPPSFHKNVRLSQFRTLKCYEM